jgi:two-component system chemotaxis response regulator CheY
VKSVLIVDDSKFMRKVLCGMLEKHGYEVVGEAANGAEALEQYQALEPDLVTMDINMPDVAGLEAVRNILAVDPGATIVMITSIGTKDRVLEVIEAGAKNYLLKPFQEEDLLRVLQTVED